MGCLLVFSVVILDKDKVVRTFRFIQTRFIRVIKTNKVLSVISASRVILLCLGVVGLFLNFSVVIFD